MAIFKTIISVLGVGPNVTGHTEKVIIGRWRICRNFADHVGQSPLSRRAGRSTAGRIDGCIGGVVVRRSSWRPVATLAVDGRQCCFCADRRYLRTEQFQTRWLQLRWP